MKVTPVNRLAGKYAGVLLPTRGFKESLGAALTNEEKYTFGAHMYSHTNLISIEDEDAGFDSAEEPSSPPAREMNMDWNGWGDAQNDVREGNGWSNMGGNRAKSQSQSSDRSGSHDRLNFVAISQSLAFSILELGFSKSFG